ncbi:hypothetical protein [Streptomyces sp. NPDC000410]|uniref:hypothetical protein n=1 Tax=Streptomyces sp. NPDC000410 TaxID=3154254 RepID=UPI003332C5FB
MVPQTPDNQAAEVGRTGRSRRLIPILLAAAGLAAPAALPQLTDEAAAAGESTAGKAHVPYIVVKTKDDYVWNLAEWFLKDGNRYPEIVALNKGRQQANGGSLQNETHLEIGWHIILPCDAKNYHWDKDQDVELRWDPPTSAVPADSVKSCSGGKKSSGGATAAALSDSSTKSATTSTARATAPAENAAADAEPKAAAEPATKAAPKPVMQSEPKPATKAAAEPAPQSEPKSTTRSEPKAAPQSETSQAEPSTAKKSVTPSEGGSSASEDRGHSSEGSGSGASTEANPQGKLTPKLEVAPQSNQSQQSTQLSPLLSTPGTPAGPVPLQQAPDTGLTPVVPGGATGPLQQTLQPQQTDQQHQYLLEAPLIQDSQLPSQSNQGQDAGEGQGRDAGQGENRNHQPAKQPAPAWTAPADQQVVLSTSASETAAAGEGLRATGITAGSLLLLLLGVRYAAGRRQKIAGAPGASDVHGSTDQLTVTAAAPPTAPLVAAHTSAATAADDVPTTSGGLAVPPWESARPGSSTTN